MSLQLVIAQIILLSFGLLGVSTARPDLIPDYASKMVLALVLTFLVARLRPKAFLQLGTPVWMITLILLLFVLVIGVGSTESSATKRWLDFGSLRFQPSEFAKLGLIMMLASFFSRRGVQNKLLSATIMIVLTTGLVFLEPDLGTSVLVFGLGIILMYGAGVRFTYISGFLLTLVLLGLPWLNTYLERSSYIARRLSEHASHKEIIKNGLDQVGMAQRDLDLGGLWGLGPDGLRYGYFAAHTDMIVAAIGFTTGLLGVVMVLFAYWLIVATALETSQLAAKIRPMTPELHGASILAIGCMFMIVGQAFINLMVAARVIPVTGVPLPMVSYGFSSIMTMSLAMGILHSATREVRRYYPQAAEVTTDITNKEREPELATST